MLKLFKLTLLLLLLGLSTPTQAQEYRDIAPQKQVEQNYLYDPYFHFPSGLRLEAIVGDYISPPILEIDPKLKFREYLWQIGDKREEITKLPVLSFKYESAGSYTLVVSARDQHGELHVATLPVVVKPNTRQVKGEATIQSSNYKSAGGAITETLDKFGGYPILMASGIAITIIVTWLLIGRRKSLPAVLVDSDTRPLLAKRINR